MEAVAATALTTVVGLFFGEAVKEGGKKFGTAAVEKVGQLTALVRGKFRDTGTEGVLARAEKEPTEKNVVRFSEELEEHLKDPEFVEHVGKLVSGLEQEGLTQEILKDARLSGGLKVGDVVQRRRPGTPGKQSIAEGLQSQGDVEFGNLTQEG